MQCQRCGCLLVFSNVDMFILEWSYVFSLFEPRAPAERAVPWARVLHVGFRKYFLPFVNTLVW